MTDATERLRQPGRHATSASVLLLISLSACSPLLSSDVSPKEDAAQETSAETPTPDTSNAASDAAQDAVTGDAPAEPPPLGEAVEYYRQAADTAPDDASCQLALADALADAGRDMEAIEAYAVALSAAIRQPKPPSLRAAPPSYVLPASVIHRLAQRYPASMAHGANRGRASYGIPTSTAPRPEFHRPLLELYRDALADKQWNPSQDIVLQILDQMAALLAARPDARGAVLLWLDHRARFEAIIRDRLAMHLPRVAPMTDINTRLRENLADAPEDSMARLLLGDALRINGNGAFAVMSYNRLSEKGVYRMELGQAFDAMGRPDRSLPEYQAVLSTHAPGTEEHTHVLGLLGWAHFRMGDKQKAIACFRQALKHEPADEASLLEGLRMAGAHVPSLPHKADADLSDQMKLLQARAYAMNAAKEYDKAIALCEQILAEHATDLQTTALLARSQIGAGNVDQAVTTLEKAYDMPPIGESDYGVEFHLVRLYEKRNEIDKLVALHMKQHRHTAIAALYRRIGRPEKYEAYLQERLEEHPEDAQLRLCLIDYYLDEGQYESAWDILTQLRDESQDDPSIDLFALASHYERFGEPAAALKLLEPEDYASEQDLDDRLGTCLMRLYADTDQLPKALDVCLLRLQKDPNGRRTVRIAQEIVEQAVADEGRIASLKEFLNNLPDELPSNVAVHFRDAAHASLRYELGADMTPRSEVIRLLERGRIVATPTEADSLLDFIGALAAEAGGSVRYSCPRFEKEAAKLPAPKIGRLEAPAYELLAEAINGHSVSLSCGSSNNWSIHAAGPLSQPRNEREKRTYPAAITASGGAIFALDWKEVQRPTEGDLIARGGVRLDSALMPNLIGIQVSPEVTQAIDNLGRDVALPQDGASHYSSGPVSFCLRNLDPPADSIAKLEVKCKVAICTKWAEITSDTLDDDLPATLEHEGIKVIVDKWKTAIRDNDQYDSLSVTYQMDKAFASGEDGNLNLGQTAAFLTRFLVADGTQTQPRMLSGSGIPSQFTAHMVVYQGALDRAETRLLIRLPLEVEIVPMEFTLEDVPVHDTPTAIAGPEGD